MNKSGNQNIVGFTGAMDFKANLDIKMMQLNQPYLFLLVANSMREITILHNPHNFGGSLLRPTNKGGCLVRTAPTSIPIIVDHQMALLSIQEIVPSIKDIDNYTMVDKLAALPIPLAGGGSLINLEALRSFFPTPFLCNAILATDFLSPLALILAGTAAQEEYVHEHDEEEGFDESYVDTHVELFYFWCIGVHQGQVAETRFSIAPVSNELAEWSARLHRTHVMPSIKAPITLPPSAMDTTNILWSLATKISRTSK